MDKAEILNLLLRYLRITLRILNVNNAPTLIAIKNRSVVQFAELFPDVTLTTRSRERGRGWKLMEEEKRAATGAVATARVGPKCKAANLIRRKAM